MDTRYDDELAEATRLTREGRLAEATALLQRRLSGAGPLPGLEPDKGGGPGLRARLAEALGGLAQRLRRPGGKEEPAPEPVLPEGARFLARTYTNGAGTRGYRLYLPSGYRGQPVPLVVMLHGCTQTPEDFAAGTRMNTLAEERTFLVAYPGQAQEANRMRCWNWFEPAHQERDRGEPALLAGIARAVLAEHAVDPSRVYLAGMSAGGAAAAVLAAAYPDLFAAVGVHSGLGRGAARDLNGGLAAMRDGAAAAGSLPLPAIVFHGDRDKTVNPRNGAEVVAQALRGNGPGLRPERETGQAPGGRAYTRTRFLDAGGVARVERWVVHGGGHAWSGGSRAGSHTDPKGPDASRAMLAFFLAHRRKA